MGRLIDDFPELANARVRFWQCPIPEHAQRRAVTVEWDDGVAHCTMEGCTNTSANVFYWPCDKRVAHASHPLHEGRGIERCPGVRVHPATQIGGSYKEGAY